MSYKKSFLSKLIACAILLFGADAFSQSKGGTAFAKVEVKGGKIVKVENLQKGVTDPGTGLQNLSNTALTQSQAVPNNLNFNPEANLASADKNGGSVSSTGPDLIILSVQVTDNLGPDITYNYTVKNNGTDPVNGSYKDAVYLSNDININAYDYQIAWSPRNTSVPANGSYSTGNTNTSVNSVPSGTYFLGVITDVDNQISESNENNNTNYAQSPLIQIGTYKPDLIVANVQVVGYTASAVTFNYTIQNIGNADTYPAYFYNAVYLSDNQNISPTSDYKILESYYSGVVSAGQGFTTDNITTLMGNMVMPSGSYYLGVVTDVRTQISEWNENNNTNYDSSPQIPLDSKPDLVVISAAIIKNQGTQNINTSFVYGVYLSTDSNVNTSDILAAQGTINSLAVGAQQSITSGVSTTDYPSNTCYHLGVIADIYNQINEIDENNNIGVSPDLFYGNGGNLTVTNVQITDATGPAISYNFTVKNTGFGSIKDPYIDVITLETYQIATIPHTGELIENASYVRNITTLIPANVPNGTYRMYVYTDKDNQIRESNENDNRKEVSSPRITHNGYPDLTVTSVSVTDATGPEIGYTFTVKNISTTLPVEASYKDNIYLSLNAIIDESDYQIASFNHNGVLAANGTYTLSKTTTVSSTVPDGSYYLGVLTDGNDDIPESNEGNNMAYDASPKVTIVPIADLVVTSVQVTDGTGPDISYTFTVKNQGDAGVTGNFNDNVYLSTSYPYAPFTIPIKIASFPHTGTLVAGGTYTLNKTTAVLATVPDGTYYLVVKTDGDNNISETDEANNFNSNGSRSITIISLKPDLIVTDLHVNTYSGSSISYGFSIKNQGEGAVINDFKDNVYLSVDQTISVTDYKICTIPRTGTMNSGQIKGTSVISTIPVSVPDGNYYLGVFTDAELNVTESNETNNTKYVASPVIAVDHTLPDLIVISVEVTDNIGPDVGYTFTIKNQGNTAVSNSYNDGVYLSTDTNILTSDAKIATFAHTSTLAVGETYTLNKMTEVTGVPDGNYFLGVITDEGGTVAENKENNNTGYESSPKVIILNAPDLVVTNIQVNDGIGPDIGYVFTVKNQGNAAVSNDYSDLVYLSPVPVLTSLSKLIAEIPHQGTIAPGGTYTANKTAAVTGVADGSYYIVVKTDGNDNVPESNENNNSRSTTQRNITIVSPKPDLTVTDVGATDAIGPEIAYNYTVKNLGTVAVTVSYTDKIYLSEDKILTDADYHISSSPRTGSLEPGISYNLNKANTIPAGLDDGSYYLIVKTDADNAVVESDETNNVCCSESPVFTDAEALPDLAVLTAPIIDKTGPEISFSFTVKNKGMESVINPYRDDVYLSADAGLETSDYKIASYPHSGTLASGASYTLNKTVIVNVPDGVYFLGVWTDAGNEVQEHSESNNKFSSGYVYCGSTPELSVYCVQVLDAEGPDIKYQFSMVNMGNASTVNPFKSDLYLSMDNTINTSDFKIGTISHTALNAGQSRTTTNNISVSGVPDGNYTFGVMVDAEDVIHETNETNNVGMALSPKVHLDSNAPLPDLVGFVEILDNQGPVIKYRITIKNQGTGAANGGFKVLVYLSIDNNIGSSDMLINSPMISDPIGPGQTKTIEICQNLGSLPVGSYYLGVIIDGQSNITESDENNNVICAASPQIVIGNPSTSDIKPVAASPQSPGSEFWADIKIGEAVPVANLFGLSFVLSYTESAYIDYVSAESGAFMGSDAVFFSTPDDPNGQVAVGITRRPDEGGVNGSGVVARIRLKSLPTTPSGTSVTLSLTDIRANDPSGNVISINPYSAVVTISSEGLVVWPGDANNDGKVDQGDVLPIGMYFGMTGPARVNASTNWTGQPAQPWNPVNATYADCNGDGTVDQADINCVGLNYGKTHTMMFARASQPVRLGKSAGIPGLIPSEESGAMPPLGAGAEWYATIEVGDADNMVNDLFGLSFILDFSKSAHLIEIMEEESGSFMGSDVIFFPMLDDAKGLLSVGICKKAGQTGSNGSGVVLRLKIKNKATLSSKDGLVQTLMITRNVSAMDIYGNTILIEGTGSESFSTMTKETISPIAFSLMQNYPNPFNAATTIEFELPEPSMTSLTVYDINGRIVKTLFKGLKDPGKHRIVWDASGVTTGIYFLDLKTTKFRKMVKMTLLK